MVTRAASVPLGSIDSIKEEFVVWGRGGDQVQDGVMKILGALHCAH